MPGVPGCWVGVQGRLRRSAGNEGTVTGDRRDRWGSSKGGLGFPAKQKARQVDGLRSGAGWAWGAGRVTS